MLGYLALPMSVGSVLGAIVGGDLAAWFPTTLLRMIFAVILAVSAAKLLAAKPKLRLNALQTPLFAYSQRLKTEIVRTGSIIFVSGIQPRSGALLVLVQG
jgi:uncharacterized membrane protein YfcA